MSRFNQGIVLTNNKCVGCNRCISVCPSMGANVSSNHEGRQRVDVSKKCIECGLCTSVCEHGARVYKDDCDAFLEALKKGEKISILVDPAFYFLYSDKAGEIFGTLKELGVNKIYDIAFGAEISMYAHAKYLKEHMGKNHQCKQFIANSCSALNNFVECIAPNLLPYMIPVHSPSMCTAIYVKNYIKDDSKLALITPCITQIDEANTPDNGNLIDYAVSFSNISKYLKKEGFCGKKAMSDLSTTGYGNLTSFEDGFLQGVSLFFDKQEVFTHYCGVSDDSMENLMSSADAATVPHSLMVTIAVCQRGCVAGTAVPKKDSRSAKVMPMYRKIRSQSLNLVDSCIGPDEYYDEYVNRFKDLDLRDFMRVFEDRYRQPYIIPDDVTNAIYASMHKSTKVKQNINCRSCGYKTCKEMVEAVANGYARVQDCVHYMNDDLVYSSFIDKMTGIANREGFKKRARELLEDNPDKNYMLLVGNVNKLKNVNDLYGTDVGDQVLMYIAKRLKEISGKDGAVGRFGGGVFALFLEDKPEVLDSFFAYERVNVRHLGVYFPITIRYGMYKVSDRATKLGDVLNLCTYAADTATDRTRHTYILYDASMREEMYVETEITLKMRDAMENGEFVIYLQPQYDHKTGKLVGAEALCRWIKEDGSIVSPGLFIPVFEKNGFIKDLDRHIWESAFKLVQKWEQSGVKQVPISVNISRISLENDEIISTIAELSKKYPINKEHLYFEITESAYMKDQANLTTRIYKLKDLGFKIAMDDFGSGYSSLNSLKDIPIDIIKLDMGFLRGGTNVERGNQIIAYMVDMSKALKLKIVAEGVETKEQADFLTERGCDVIQGFFYAKPMPLSQFEEKVENES